MKIISRRNTRLRYRRALRSSLVPIAVGIAASGGAALVNHLIAKRAEDQNPPCGRFITVNGVRLHYFEQGAGPPLVLLHGNASMIQDFRSSGLVGMASRKYRVIVFDRPGYGYSERPRWSRWGPLEQADLLTAALKQLGVSHAVVLGHSWGTLVAIAMAQKQQTIVRALVLTSGYYYPSFRLDALWAATGAVPLIGDYLNQTLSPWIARLVWPLALRTMFGPNDVPSKYKSVPKALAVRPSQLKAGAQEGALMASSAASAKARYHDLRMPVAIVVGEGDKVVDPEQAIRLHGEIGHSLLDSLPGVGHMVHQTATAALMAAIDSVGTPSQTVREG